MRNIRYTFILIAAMIMMGSCSEEYFDVNTPVDSVNLDQINMKDLFAPVLYNTLLNQYTAGLTLCNYSQNLGSYGYGSAGKSELTATWNNIYLDIIPNLDLIMAKAQESNSVTYMGAVYVIEAANLGLATDTWGSIPFTQVNDPATYPHPSFDSQESIYTQIISDLDQAISLLGQTDNSVDKMGNDDLIYKGNQQKWLRAAYTLKARYQLRLMRKGIVTPSAVLQSLSNGLESNDDNFLMVYPQDKLNPWHQNTILSRRTGNIYWAPNDQLISLMNGSQYPFLDGGLSIDPRLPAIYANEGAPGDPWRAAMNGGDGASSDGESANTFFSETGYLTKADSPLVLISYAEAKFIEAEANFLLGGGNETSSGINPSGYEAYLTGIAASMGQIGVDGGAYLSDSAVNVGAANLMLNHIMKEKYIANQLNPETFSDLRRYNFSADVFKGLALRLEDDDTNDEYAGQWFRRAVYPTTERNTNPSTENYYTEPTISVWWAE